MDLNERVAIVTGGARGIGLAIAEDLASHGANVVIVDAGVSIAGQPDEPRLAEHIVEGKDRWAAVCGDIADADVARAAVQIAQKRFGAVDIVVNNAAIIRDAFIFKSDDAAWDAVIRTNLTGAQRLLGAATPAMREQAKAGRARGRSQHRVAAGLYGNFGHGAYGARKPTHRAHRVAAHDLARSESGAIRDPVRRDARDESIKPSICLSRRRTSRRRCMCRRSTRPPGESSRARPRRKSRPALGAPAASCSCLASPSGSAPASTQEVRPRTLAAMKKPAAAFHDCHRLEAFSGDPLPEIRSIPAYPSVKPIGIQSEPERIRTLYARCAQPRVNSCMGPHGVRRTVDQLAPTPYAKW